MDFLTLHRGKFLVFYILPCFALGGIFYFFTYKIPVPLPWAREGAIGFVASISWQLGVLFLRFFTRSLAASLVTTISMLSVLISFLGNLGFLAYIAWFLKSQTMIFGFLIAYIFHLVLLVFASYCSATPDQKS